MTADTAEPVSLASMKPSNVGHCTIFLTTAQPDRSIPPIGVAEPWINNLIRMYSGGIQKAKDSNGLFRSRQKESGARYKSILTAILKFLSEGSRDQLDLSIALQSAKEPFRSVFMTLVARRVNIELNFSPSQKCCNKLFVDQGSGTAEIAT